MSVEGKESPKSYPKASGPTTYRGGWKKSATNPTNVGVGSGPSGMNDSKSKKGK